MRFYGTPNEVYYKRFKMPYTMKPSKKPIFKFDEKGEFVTDDPKLIAELKTKFKFEQRKCKKCDFVCEGQSELLAHYRKNHPKE